MGNRRRLCERSEQERVSEPRAKLPKAASTVRCEHRVMPSGFRASGLDVVPVLVFLLGSCGG